MEVLKKIFGCFAVGVLVVALYGCSDSDDINDTEINPTDGIVINGVRWATRNVGAPGTFAANPESSGMFFQWNRRRGWAATGNVTGWNTTTPTGITWEATNDPCPTGWRVPTREELQSLVDAGCKWTTQNGVNGRLFGIAPYQIFLPAAGWRNFTNGGLGWVGENGIYWGSAPRGSVDAMILNFANYDNRVLYNFRTFGFSIRCVAQ